MLRLNLSGLSPRVSQRKLLLLVEESISLQNEDTSSKPYYNTGWTPEGLRVVTPFTFIPKKGRPVMAESEVARLLREIDEAYEAAEDTCSRPGVRIVALPHCGKHHI